MEFKTLTNLEIIHKKKENKLLKEKINSQQQHQTHAQIKHTHEVTKFGG